MSANVVKNRKQCTTYTFYLKVKLEASSRGRVARVARGVGVLELERGVVR